MPGRSRIILAACGLVAAGATVAIGLDEVIGCKPGAWRNPYGCVEPCPPGSGRSRPGSIECVPDFVLPVAPVAAASPVAAPGSSGGAD